MPATRRKRLTERRRALCASLVDMAWWFVWRRRRLLPAGCDAEEAAAHVLAWVCDGMRRYDPARGAPTTWAHWWMLRGWQVLVADARRQLTAVTAQCSQAGDGSVRLLERPDPARPCEDAVADAEAWEVAREVLPAREVELLERVYAGGESVRAVARSWGLSPQRALQLHARALARMREALS